MGPLPAPPGPGPGLTASGSRFRGSGQTAKLTPLLLRLELGEPEVALALGSDGQKKCFLIYFKNTNFIFLIMCIIGGT